MKRISILCLSILFCLTGKADEGMWIPKTLSEANLARMQELGFTMNLTDLYDEENPSLKDAIVQLNIGCTGVSVSRSGLIFTNHHCGYNAIQSLSSVEHDYLTDGFVSHSFEEELPVEGMTIRYFVKLQDVTDELLADLPQYNGEEERVMLIYDRAMALEKRLNEENPGYDIEVIAYYANNVYYANYYQKFTDIRLVFTPPSSVGKFGGDTDNWMWPRHTGDFSVFRVYADGDNKPADYNPGNRPYVPAYVAPVSISGYNEGDFTMILGYPGRTNRYLSSWGVEQRMNSSNTPRIEMRGVKQDIWEKEMRASDEVRIKYSAKFQGSSNYWKNSIGMNRGIEKMQVIPRKQQLENEFGAWVRQNPEETTKYKNALQLIEDGYTANNELARELTYIQEFISGIELIRQTRTLDALFEKGNLSPDSEELLASSPFYKDYEPRMDSLVLPVYLRMIRENLSPDNLPAIYKEIDKKYKGNYEKYAADLFKKSVFPYPNKITHLLAKEKNASKAIEKDPAKQLSDSFMDSYRAMYAKSRESQMKISEGERLFMDGLMKMNPDVDYPSDANFTMRLTYGPVGGYEPFDGAWYNYYTTPKGVLEKFVQDDPEFNMQPELLDLHRRKDFGRYANADGTMFVNFLSGNDITGGNSGSPIFDGKGRVIGLAFDGNWEAMSGDIAFEDDVQRTINVDIRYVLFIIDQWGKAQRIIDELIIE